MLMDFQSFFTDRFISKYATKLSLTTPPYLKHISALACEISILENWQKSEACIVINDKSQGSVATYLRRGGLIALIRIYC